MTFDVNQYNKKKRAENKAKLLAGDPEQIRLREEKNKKAREYARSMPLEKKLEKQKVASDRAKLKRMENPNRFYVYELLDPSKNDEVFYVGKGCGYRVKMHYSNELENSRNPYKSNIIKNYRKLGFEDKYLIVRNNLLEQEALELETELISKYREQLKRLSNICDGGKDSPKHFGDNNPAVKASKAGNHWNSGTKGQSHIRAVAGTHWSKGENNPGVKAAKLGLHWSRREVNPFLLNGTHQLLAANNHWLKKPIWDRPRSTPQTKEFWKHSSKIYDIYCADKTVRSRKLKSLCKEKLNLEFQRNLYISILNQFEKGWIPDQDLEYLNLLKEK